MQRYLHSIRSSTPSQSSRIHPDQSSVSRDPEFVPNGPPSPSLPPSLALALSPSPSPAPSTSSTSSYTSHTCIFDFTSSGDIWYNKRVLRNIQYATLGLRASHKNTKKSWVWLHGAKIQADGYSKLFLCKYCFEKKKRFDLVFDGHSTNTISNHLLKEYGVRQSNDIIDNRIQRRFTETGIPFANLAWKEWYLD
jgi:hypothetical protein